MGTGSSTTQQQKTSDLSHGGDHIQVMRVMNVERLVPVKQKYLGDTTLELQNKSLLMSEIPEKELKTVDEDGLEAPPEEQLVQGDRKNIQAANTKPGEKISKVNAISKDEVQTKADKALSDEEIQIKRQSFLDKIEEKLLALQKMSPRNLSEEGAPFSHSFRQCIFVLAKSFFNFKPGQVPYNIIYEYRDQVGKALIKHGAVETICDVLSDAMKRSDFINKDGKPLNDLWLPIKNMALILLNYSDNQNSIKMTITDHIQLLPLMLYFLKENQQSHFEKSLSNEPDKMCRFFLSIIHNCAALKGNVPKLRELKVIPVALTFLDSHAENFRLISIAILADLVNEEEAEFLRANVSIFKFLLKMLENALREESHKDAGWSAQELTRAVRQLARNDANKEILVNEGCLPSLVKLLDVGNDFEVKEAINCIWTLSFNDENKKKMLQEPHLVEKVYNLFKNSTDASQQAFLGVLWSLRDELLKSENFKTIGEEITNLKSAAKPKPSVLITAPENSIFQGHVMISYQWANQEVIKKICQELRAHAVPIWIDIDFMGGSTIQAMAKAVEDSCIVIMAMSQLYKDSPNTRAEAEYAFKRRKKIIPLIMQRGYQPDGWLGLLLGTKMYYDFSGKYPFKHSMDGLIKAVMQFVDVDSTDGIEQPLVPSKAGSLFALPPTTMPPVTLTNQPAHHIRPNVNMARIKSWTTEDISQWLTKYSLQNTKMQYLSSKEIIFLYNLKYEAPEFFYHCLESKLNLISLLDLTSASEAFIELTMI